MSLLITCDQGGWRTPSRLRSLLHGTPVATAKPVDSSNGKLRWKRQGPDHAALLAARRLAAIAGGDLVANEFRYDLIDVGRSLHHRSVMNAAIRKLPQTTRAAIVEEIYQPYRRQVESAVRTGIQRTGFVVHLSVRTYDAKTKEGKWRRGDVGLLYDPSCQDELDWSLDLIDELYELQMNLKVRRNYPGRGTNDSLTKAMRTQFVGQPYLGIELTLNRAWAGRQVTRCQRMIHDLGQAIANVSQTEEALNWQPNEFAA